MVLYNDTKRGYQTMNFWLVQMLGNLGQAPCSQCFPMRLPCFIGDQFSGASALLWSQATLGLRFEFLDERCFTQRASGVRSVSDGEKLRFRFSLLQEALPTGLRPLLAPRRHVQAGVGIGPAAMRGSARPRPRRRFRHPSGAHRIQFRIAQRCPQVARVHGAGIKSALPHMPAGRVRDVPIGGVTPMHLMERLGQSLRAARNHHHLHVVRHQAIPRHRQPVLFHGVAQQVKVNPALGISSKMKWRPFPRWVT